MKIDPHHFDPFVRLYIENQCPSERVRSNDSAIRGFTKKLNERLETAFTKEQVADFLETHQKQGELPAIGRHYSGPKFPN